MQWVSAIGMCLDPGALVRTRQSSGWRVSSARVRWGVEGVLASDRHEDNGYEVTYLSDGESCRYHESELEVLVSGESGSTLYVGERSTLVSVVNEDDLDRRLRDLGEAVREACHDPAGDLGAVAASLGAPLCCAVEGSRVATEDLPRLLERVCGVSHREVLALVESRRTGLPCFPDDSAIVTVCRDDLVLAVRKSVWAVALRTSDFRRWDVIARF